MENLFHKFESRSWRGVLDTTCDSICHWLATGRWFSPVSSTNKIDRHDMTEILLKVALNTITQILYSRNYVFLSVSCLYHNVLYTLY